VAEESCDKYIFGRRGISDSHTYGGRWDCIDVAEGRAGMVIYGGRAGMDIYLAEEREERRHIIGGRRIRDYSDKDQGLFG
jgi:hypothetical protein